MSNEEKTTKQKLFDFFQGREWPGMVIEAEKVSCPAGDILIIENKNFIIDFYYYNRRENKYGRYENRQTLILNNKVDPLIVLRTRRGTDYNIQWFDYIKKILDIDEHYSKVKITKTGKKILRKFSEKIIQIPEAIFSGMTADACDVYKKGQSSKGRLETYLINKLKLKYTNRIPKETTTVAEGDFSFMIERFNLKNKNKKKDYKNFLNEEDIKNLEWFAEKLIKDEVLSSDFLHSLDEYFIKTKLKDIIAIGHEILALGAEGMATKKARKVISKVVGNSSIKQLENLWQQYFEKYLLYLVFSYKKIYPKVNFTDIEGDKKYPDFIGINHYNGLDVIEIKTHLKNSVTWDSRHKNFGFSSELSKAIIQTMNYMDAIVQQRFQSSSDEKKITNFTEEENLYHPRGIIIISSDKNLTKSRLNSSKEKCLKRDFTKLRNSLQNIEILTFDEILRIADDYVKNIHHQYEN